MAQRSPAYFGESITRRGLALAERRLAYLAELYKSGRWRRFYDDADFLLWVREAKASVEAWRRLLPEPIDGWNTVSHLVPESNETSLVPFGAVGISDARVRQSLLQMDRAGGMSDLVWRNTRLPPVEFSAHSVLAKHDLTEG